jgi:hypothetical protein
VRLAGLCDLYSSRAALAVAGGAGLPQPIPGGDQYESADRATPVLDAVVPGVSGSCHRLVPMVVARIAGSNPARVAGSAVVGRLPDGAVGPLCREPDAGDSPPHDRAPRKHLEGLTLMIIRHGRRWRDHLTPLSRV